MGKFDEEDIQWCKELREEFQKKLQAYKSGTTIMERRATEDLRDITPKLKEEAKRIIDLMDRLIAAQK